MSTRLSINVVTQAKSTDSVSDRSSRKMKEKKEKELKQGNRYFAGNLSIVKDTRDFIGRKKDSAQKQAMRMIRDAWEKDQKRADSVKAANEEHSKLVQEIRAMQDQLNDIEDGKLAIQKEYGIKQDSQEQKDMELIEKYQDYLSGSLEEEFSEEDIERLKQIQTKPRTEYQSRILSQNRAAGELKYEIHRKTQMMIGIQDSIVDMKLAQLKSQDMLNARNAADAVLKSSAKEVMGILVQDGVGQIDENMKEEQEKAKEAEEKKEEKEEKIDKAKERSRQERELLEKIANADKFEADISTQQDMESSVEDAQKSIQKIIEKNSLVNEDLKGIEIDLNF